MITGVPQIRSSHRASAMVRHDGALTAVSRYLRKPFTPLTFRALVPPKGFLVIGPSREVAREYTLGNRFFIEMRDGLQFETVLILLPEVIRKPVSPTPVGAGPPGTAS